MTDEMIEAVKEAIKKDIRRSLEVMDDGITLGNLDEWHFASASRAAIAAHKSALAKAGMGIRPRIPPPPMQAAGSGALGIEGLTSVRSYGAAGRAWVAMFDTYPDKPDG